MGYPTPTRPWGAGFDQPRTVTINDRQYTETPISAEDMAMAAVYYWGEGHTPLADEDLQWLRGQITLDRHYAKGKHPWSM